MNKVKVKIHVELWAGEIFLEKDFIEEVLEEKVNSSQKMANLCYYRAEQLVLDHEDEIFNSLPEEIQDRFDVFPQYWGDFIDGVVEDTEYSWERL